MASDSRFYRLVAMCCTAVVMLLNSLAVFCTIANEKQIQIVGKYGNYTWPRRDLSVSETGQIVLGALHMVHERSEDKICGPIMPQGGIQALETMLFTIDKVNNDNLIPGIRLGVLAKDDCDRDIYGLEQAVDFIRGSIANIGGYENKCTNHSDLGLHLKVIPGVLGAPSSVTSIQVATLLKLFKIPQVSFFSTSPVLSVRDRYPYFMRTIPSDVNQAQAMVELVKMFKWTYVSVVYEESSYGIQGFNELEKLLKLSAICIATTEKLLKDSGVAGQASYDTIVDRLKQKSNARGVIIFGSDQEVGELMEAVRRRNATGMFSWIGSDGWGGRGLAYLDKEAEVEGAVTVQPLAYEVIGFKDYFLNLKPETNARNPWFIEYWEQQFRCKYPKSSWTPYNEEFAGNPCTGQEVMSEEEFDMEAQLQFVSDSVLAFAHAFKDMHQVLCEGKPGLCPNMDPVEGEILKRFLLNVSFTGLSGQEFSFLANGDGPARYRILNFRQKSNGEYSWDTVGFFKNGSLIGVSRKAKRMKINQQVDDLVFRMDEEPEHPESVCSKDCAFDEAYKIIDGDTCCWSCVKCDGHRYLPNKFNCAACPMGTIPSYDRKRCSTIPMSYLNYSNPIAITAMTFSTLGIMATGFVMLVFLRFNDSPIVKASGRELSFVLLIGIFLCYGMTFILVSKPNSITCGAQKYGIGLCFSIVYSAILTKTNRISRIFRAGKRTCKRPKFISPKSQLVICGAFVAFQNAVGIVWILLRPPKAVPFYANREDHQLVCLDAVESWYMIGFTYPIFLIIVCTFYAIWTRNIPEAFNESKYIGLTMYTTCIIWLAFVPIYFSTADNIQIRIATMCFSISLSATVGLVCMFTSKLSIIILHPDQNVRQSIMASKPVMPVQIQNNYYSTCRIESATQSEDTCMELTHRLRPSGSFSSAFSRSTSATQTFTNGNSISTQTLDMIGKTHEDRDVQL
ncbi:metabotropic glutamate receptor 6-like [Ylistrum balloti]|uniref:metabotropic glutamate receptor 6-like n=1 Tax=Ylistrum balloti TaxID=509963 RepID=UPI0029059E4B|nr:metabotropic glutamate receptor 6-like [Ylistrum balloti]